MQLPLRYLGLLLLALPIGLRWYALANYGQPPVRVADDVLIMQTHAEYGTTIMHAIVSSVARDGFQVDSPISAPIRHGVVLDESGRCLGYIDPDENAKGQIFVRRLRFFDGKPIASRR